MGQIKIISFLSISICSILIAFKSTDIIHQKLFSCAAIAFSILAIHKINAIGTPKFEAVSLINKFTEYDTKKIHL